MNQESVSSPQAAFQPHRESPYQAPLDGAREGQLRLQGGGSATRLRGKRYMSHLYRATFAGVMPQVVVDQGVVSIRQGPRFGEWLGAVLAHLRGERSEVILNAAIPWAVQIEGGASDLDADL